MLHGGRIWAESDGEGCGTTLHVVLPRGEMDAASGDLDEEVLSDGTGRVLGLGRSIEAVEAELNLQGDGQPGDGFVEMERTVGRWEGRGGSDREKAGNAEVESEVAGAGLTSATPEVLIAEDNPDMRELLAMLVGREFRVRLTRNGREALESLRESAPDLVLSDVMMPEMSGTELCGAIKADQATRAIPVVLVTSKAERDMKIEGLELGADDYVTKPFHPRELLARVRSLVRVRGLQKELAERNQALEQALAEIKKAEVQLVQSERLAAVGELAAGIAHEVNNPVNFALNAARAMTSAVAELREVTDRVLGFDWRDAERVASQVAESRRAQDQAGMAELADRLSELAEIVGDGLKRTAGLVGDLRDFAATGAKRKLEGRADVDIAKGVQSTIQLLKHSAAKAGAEIQLKVPEQRLRIRGDAGALNQVFLNLVKNAADALDGSGGVIRVEVSEVAGGVQIAVADDGPGMSAEVQERLFEPFFSTKEAGRGTGLGLSISRQIVEAHGGRIDVASELGVGSTVVVQLPHEGARSGLRHGAPAEEVDAGGEGCAT
jgi:signal transduction histidine kinase